MEKLFANIFEEARKRVTGDYKPPSPIVRNSFG
jgi:hypothetical protein